MQTHLFADFLYIVHGFFVLQVLFCANSSSFFTSNCCLFKANLISFSVAHNFDIEFHCLLLSGQTHLSSSFLYIVQGYFLLHCAFLSS